jgi:hypothetical protein
MVIGPSYVDVFGQATSRGRNFTRDIYEWSKLYVIIIRIIILESWKISLNKKGSIIRREILKNAGKISMLRVAFRLNRHTSRNGGTE